MSDVIAAVTTTLLFFLTMRRTLQLPKKDYEYGRA